MFFLNVLISPSDGQLTFMIRLLNSKTSLEEFFISTPTFSYSLSFIPRWIAYSFSTQTFNPKPIIFFAVSGVRETL